MNGSSISAEEGHVSHGVYILLGHGSDVWCRLGPWDSSRDVGGTSLCTGHANCIVPGFTFHRPTTSTSQTNNNGSTTTNTYTVDDPSILQSGRHRIPQDGRYKCVGGASTLDSSMVYLFPCDAERVLNGSIYFMPLCAKACSKIVPATSAVR